MLRFGRAGRIVRGGRHKVLLHDPAGRSPRSPSKNEQRIDGQGLKCVGDRVDLQNQRLYISGRVSRVVRQDADANGRPMRWFVEISSIGAGSEPPIKLCVDAPQWQPALQKARALRGDEGPLSNFSIELLEEGYRAVDPATRKRYFVSKAPDDAPVTTSEGEARPAPPAAKPEPMVEEKPAQTPAPAATLTRKAMVQTMVFGSAGPAPVRADADKAPPAPVALPPKQSTTMGMPAVSAAPVRKATSPGMVAVSVPLPPMLPQHKVHSSREENATSSSPLTYREFVYVVAEGTNEDAAKDLLLDRLDNLMKSVGDIQGKLVHMAVFDHAYQGKPQRKPLATLSFRDWRGEPVVVFPARREQHANEAPVKPASTPPPALTRSVTPPPARIAVPAPKPSAPAIARPIATPMPPKASTPPPAAAKLSTPSPAAAKLSTPPPAAAKLSTPPPAAAKLSTPPPKASVPPRPKSADEVMAELSGAMTDMHFLRDAIEAADFILKLVSDKFPSELVLVWFHDADKRELVLVRQAGGTTDQLLTRISDKAGLAQAAMRSQRAVVITDAARDPRANEARWKAIGVEPKSMVIAPAMNSGKPFGLVEMLNPKAGGRYSSLENNALTYIGQQLGEFLANNSVILDGDRVTAGAKRIG